MQIEFWGAIANTTGSRHLLKVNGQKILLECGLFQGHRAESRELNLNFPFKPEELNTLVLSHAHIDHCGNIPNLVKQGFTRPIFSTSATNDLCRSLLRDSAYIQEKDIEYLNEKRARKGEPALSPLYTLDDADHSLEFFQSLSYHYPITIGSGISCSFLDAGHILGSAIVTLNIDESGRKRRLVFSGDLGRKNLPILRDPEIPEGADFLILESTYGGRLHEPIEKTEQELKQVINRVVERGGKIIVPSFALERTQEIVYCLRELWDRQEIPRIPVFVDSPLAVDITQIFRLHPECYDRETRDVLLNQDDPFGFGSLAYIRKVERSKELNHLQSPAIIISASGMCEAGRILHHLKNNIEDPKNLVLIVGFQAKHTLGRRVVERQPEVRIFGETYKLRAEVKVMNSFSAHADAQELTEFAQAVAKQGKLKQIILVHGEEDQTQALVERLKSRLDIPVILPQLGAPVEL